MSNDYLKPAGINKIFYDPKLKEGYIVQKTCNNPGPLVVSGPYLSPTTTTIIDNSNMYNKKTNYTDINMSSELTGTEYIRRCIREILLDRDSFPEERKALLEYLQSVVFDLIEDERLEEIKEKMFEGLYKRELRERDNKIKDLEEKIDYILSKVKL